MKNYVIQKGFLKLEVQNANKFIEDIYQLFIISGVI